MARIVAAALGDCIHVIGVRNFLAIADNAGFESVFLGAAVPVSSFAEAVVRDDPEVVGVSYRLSPGVCARLLNELRAELQRKGAFDGRTYLFGGTEETGKVAREAGFFSEVFDGSQTQQQVVAFVKHLTGSGSAECSGEDALPARTLLERIQRSLPVPILRHHIGLPTVDETVVAVQEIADAQLLDVISIAPDQVAQESFFRPSLQDKERTGAGGVPLRTHVDLVRIFEATRRGNYPLIRCYSGTQDVEQWADLLLKTVDNAWSAIPLSWYNVMDRRGPRTLAESIPQAQELMRWHAKRGVPVEVNEPHQWGLRRASDAVSVATAFLGAYNAKQAGVKTYVSQYMLNTPAGMSPSMDLAKALAMIEMVEGLRDVRFLTLREVRPGLSSFPSSEPEARAQLMFATILGMMLKPDIFHVVACCEARHAARAQDIIDGCRMARWAMNEYLRGSPEEGWLTDERVLSRKRTLISEATAILDAIKALSEEAEDPMLSPQTLETAIRLGILDAPDLAGSGVALGRVRTAILQGACVNLCPETGEIQSEQERVQMILEGKTRL